MLAQDMTDLSGQRFGNYEIEELLQVRKVSNLYLARDTQLDAPVYLIVLKANAEDDPDLVSQFERRMESLSQTKHPNIAPVTDIGITDSGFPYAVVEYIDGITLEQQIAEWNQSGKLLSAEEALHISRQVASALSVAHSVGLIHHDLRPENIIMSDSSTPVLIDLGVPAVIGPPEAVLNGSEAEMLSYASPEEQEGKALSRRSNIYSLGILQYELLTGHRPKLPASSWDIFERSTMPKEIPLEEAREGLAGETYRLVRNCLWRQEWSRFETVDEVITAIDTAVLAEQATPSKTTAIWSDQRRTWRYVAIAAVVVFAGLLAYALFAGGSGNNGTASNSPTPGFTQVPAAGGILASPTVEPSPSATATREAPPTTAAQIPIGLVLPAADAELNPERGFEFSWFWPTELQPTQEFSILFGADVEGAELEPLGTIRESGADSVYRFTVSPNELDLEPGLYLWQVQLVDSQTNGMIAESNQRRLIAIASTPTPTNTPSPTVSPTPEEEACVPTRPTGWTEVRIRAGESIALYAQRANVPVESILAANCLPENPVLSIGQQLFVPQALATDTPTPSPILPTVPPSSGGGGGGNDNGGGSQPTSVPPTSAPPTRTPKPPPGG